MSELTRIRVSVMVLLVACSMSATAQSAAKCPKGYQPFGEGCVTQRMFDYISCVETSGANHQEMTEEVNDAANRQLSGEAKGEGSGVVAKGKGSIVVNANSEKQLVKKIQQKWYSDAMKQCANVLQSPRKKTGSGDKSTGRSIQQNLSGDPGLPRAWSLDPQQENSLRSYLKKTFSAPRPFINTIGPLNDRDAESYDLAKELKSIFEAAGFKDIALSQISRWNGNPPFHGIMVYGNTSADVGSAGSDPDCRVSPNAPEDALLLRGAFKTILPNEDVHLCLQNTRTASDIYWVIVGTSPRSLSSTSGQLAQQNSNLSQRSYVTIGRKDGVVANFVPSKNAEQDAALVIYFQNSGHVPAKLAWGTWGTGFVSGPSAEQSSGIRYTHPFIGISRTRDKKTGTIGESGENVLVAGGSTFMAPIGQISEKDLIALPAKNLSTMVMGKYQYCDELGTSVLRTFMLSYHNAPSADLNFKVVSDTETPLPAINSDSGSSLEYLSPCRPSNE